jgi:type II secretory pathway pseudopilin PulG
MVARRTPTTSDGPDAQRPSHQARHAKRLGEAGDTLVEVLIAIAVIGITAAALLGGFSTSIAASADHKTLSSLDTVLKSFIETSTYQIQQQPIVPDPSNPQGPPLSAPLFDASCPTPFPYSTLNLVQGGYTAKITGVQYLSTNPLTPTWGGCVANASPPQAQLLTARASGNGVSASVSFVVADPNFIPSPPSPPSFTSSNTATWLAGSPFSFNVTTLGSPDATISASGLPVGVTLGTSSFGAALLSTSSVAAGTYPNIVFTAANGNLPNATQNFTLVVNAGPTITSANSATFAVGSPGSFTVTTSGTPRAVVAGSGTLPSGVTFVPNPDGTATLSGTPAAGTLGSYPIMITATNGIGAQATQTLTLVVATTAFTSANSASVSRGASFTVTTVGTPPAALTVGALPSRVTFVDNGNGTATIHVANNAAVGTSQFTITATTTVPAGTTTQAFTLTVTT